MDFGDALKALRNGKRVARASWKVKGYWLILVPGSKIVPQEGRPLGQAAPELVGATLDYQPHIDKWYGHGRIGTWSPSHEALLAQDWTIL